MATLNSRVTIHMAASLDGFIARKDGRVDWLETARIEFRSEGVRLGVRRQAYNSGIVELRYDVPRLKN
jgi:riboflavin biosynthesis pyrimidine reductase